jgi:ATP-dependent helicase/nuclease subunit A
MTQRQQFTAQQAAAIQARGVSVALSAGAGCGKTFVLTQRFLAGLELTDGNEPANELHQLVAITFTERAAREMRDRIRDACHARLQGCDQNQVQHWLGILRGLDSARISTIHSFCSSLLRSQAVEANLDPGFALLEPALADTLLRHVAQNTLHDLIEAEDDDAYQLVVQFGLERARELLRKLTSQRFQIDFSAFREMSPEQLALEWMRKWHSEFVPKLVGKFRESPIIEKTLSAISGSPSKHVTMIDRIAYLSETLWPETPWNDIPTTLANIHEHARITGGGGKKDWETEERKEEIKLAFQKLRESVEKLRETLDFRPEDVTTSAELACRAIRLTAQTAEQYAAAKKNQGVLDFDDLLLHTRNLLRDNESVRKRVAAGIQLLMVDEFQDTDPVQADVVRSLCGAALTQGKLFMVGDRKQSIYRFRRADPTVFSTMSNEIPASGRLPLNVNFRSQPAVLNFVNHLFAPAMDRYEPLVPFQNQQHSPTPGVEFLFAGFDAEGADAESPITTGSNSGSKSDDDDIRANAAELRAREADWIARRIAMLLADPAPRIRGKEKDPQGNPLLRRTKPGDIVILFRALSSVQEYETALRRYGLNYYLVGGKAFFAQQEIFDLLNLCRYLDDCDDHVGLVGILRSPFFNLSDDAIHALAVHTEAAATQEKLQPVAATRATLSLHQTLYLEPPAYLPEDQKSRIRFAAEILTNLRNRKDRIPLSDLLTEAVEQTGYDAAILIEFLGDRKLANLRKLIEMARQFDQRDFFTLTDFVNRLQTSVIEETDEEFATTLPESGDVIRLMSIHQSKGLEFPVVIVADIDRKGPPRGSEAVLHPDLGPLIKPLEQFGSKVKNLALEMHKLAEQEADAEETIRLFYVACTRAADYLILSSGIEPDKPPQSPWRELLETRFDIRTGLLKTDPLLGSSESGTAAPENIPEILVHHVPCEANRAEPENKKRISLGQIPGRVIEATPADFPESSAIFPRNKSDLRIVSVSRLEAIDAQIVQAQKPKKTVGDDEIAIDPDMATTLGTIVHTVLERIDFREPSHWPDLLKKVVEQYHDKVSHEVVQQASTMLTRFFDSRLAEEFSQVKTIHREIDFLLPWPGNELAAAPARPATLIAGVIDLLIETEAGWHVLDYKTGDFPPQISDDQLIYPYVLQLGLYAHAVEQWFGSPPVELSLITFRPRVRRITMPWTQAHWDQIRKRVEQAIWTLKSDSDSSDDRFRKG